MNRRLTTVNAEVVRMLTISAPARLVAQANTREPSQFPYRRPRRDLYRSKLTSLAN
jgi:hypothetical protein